MKVWMKDPHSGGVKIPKNVQVVTDVCVAQTTREFGDRDFNAIVVEDACATLDETRHKAALDTIGLSFETVVSTDEVLKLLQK